MELLEEMKLGEKLYLIKTIEGEVLADTEEKYRKLKDLIMFCRDQDVDIVIKALKSLCRVFCEILPSYRIRTDFDNEKGITVSKEVQKLRDLENF
jgi:hypothetical protein